MKRVFALGLLLSACGDHKHRGGGGHFGALGKRRT